MQQIIVRMPPLILGNCVTSDNSEIEPRDTTRKFNPKFDANGLITAVVIENHSKDVLMVAHMNLEAINATQETGIAHFWSRSRQELWQKGATSGNSLKVIELRIDCDQDALLMFVDPAGPACHTGEHTCFYRILDNQTLVKVKS